MPGIGGYLTSIYSVNEWKNEWMRKGNYPGFVSSLIMEIIIYWNHENEDGFSIK